MSMICILNFLIGVLLAAVTALAFLQRDDPQK